MLHAALKMLTKVRPHITYTTSAIYSFKSDDCQRRIEHAVVSRKVMFRMLTLFKPGLLLKVYDDPQAFKTKGNTIQQFQRNLLPMLSREQVAHRERIR